MRVVLFAWVSLVACAPPDPGSARIIGHGGSGAAADAPMNSQESLLGALRLGIDGIELDAQLTADSVLVAFHALRLEDGTGCTGMMNSRTWAELGNCGLSSAGASLPLVRVDSLLIRAIAAYPTAEFTLDCKLLTEGDWWQYLQAFSDAVLELDDHPALHGRILVECQSLDFLRLLGLKQKGFPTFYYATEFDGSIDLARSADCAGITMMHDRLDQEQAERIRSAGLSLTLFGTSSEWSHRHAFSLRPDRLQTDLPAYAKGLRRSAH